MYSLSSTGNRGKFVYDRPASDLYTIVNEFVSAIDKDISALNNSGKISVLKNLRVLILLSIDPTQNFYEIEKLKVELSIDTVTDFFQFDQIRVKATNRLAWVRPRLFEQEEIFSDFTKLVDTSVDNEIKRLSSLPPNEFETSGVTMNLTQYQIALSIYYREIAGTLSFPHGEREKIIKEIASKFRTSPIKLRRYLNKFSKAGAKIERLNFSI
ncbi:MAG: hypothetical protein WDN75_06970 [Bacteroidota bacterium]